MPLTAEPRTGRHETLRLVLDGVGVDVSEAGAGPSRIIWVDHLALEPGASLGLTGPSGAGKTTLLHVIAGIVRPTVGRVLWGDHDLAGLSGSARDRWRRDTVGLVFQDFQLIPELDVLANVLLPATFGTFRPTRAVLQRARDLLDRVGLRQENRRASVLSPGRAAARCDRASSPPGPEAHPRRRADGKPRREQCREHLRAASRGGAR